MAQTDPWLTLGISRGSDAKAIKAAYRRLAKLLHPDVAGNDPAISARFRQVQIAYEGLIRLVSPAAQEHLYQRWVGLEEVMTGCRLEVELDGRSAAIDIPCGVHSGDKIVANSDAGKIVVEIMVRRHETVHRYMNDILVTEPIDALDAIMGKTGHVVEIFGKNVEIDIPAGIQHDDIMRFSGKGFPHRGDPTNRGDLVILAKIVIFAAKKSEMPLFHQIRGLR